MYRYIYCTSGYELITWICLKIDNQLPSYPSRLSMCLADFVAEETGWNFRTFKVRRGLGWKMKSLDLPNKLSGKMMKKTMESQGKSTGGSSFLSPEIVYWWNSHLSQNMGFDLGNGYVKQQGWWKNDQQLGFLYSLEMEMRWGEDTLDVGSALKTRNSLDLPFCNHSWEHHV